MSSPTTGTTDYNAGYQPGAYPASADAIGESAGGWADQCRGEMTRAVEENPSGTLMTAFGVGLGIGAAIGLAVAFSAPKHKPRTRAEELGQRILDSLHDYIPDSLSHRFG